MFSIFISLLYIYKRGFSDTHTHCGWALSIGVLYPAIRLNWLASQRSPSCVFITSRGILSRNWPGSTRCIRLLSRTSVTVELTVALSPPIHLAVSACTMWQGGWAYRRPPEKGGRRRLPVRQIAQIRAHYEKGCRITELAEAFGLHPNVVANICHERTHPRVPAAEGREIRPVPRRRSTRPSVNPAGAPARRPVKTVHIGGQRQTVYSDGSSEVG